MEWFERARAAEEIHDWDTAIDLAAAHAVCCGDSDAHDSHLWHMDLLARARRLTELTRLARTDIHARRSLNRHLGRQGRDTALLDRARDGDRGALYVLVRLLCETGRSEEARRAVLSIAPDDTYAHHILEPHRPPPLGTT